MGTSFGIMSSAAPVLGPAAGIVNPVYGCPEPLEGRAVIHTNERLLYERAVLAVPDSVATLRRELGAALAHDGVDETRRYDIALVLTEAAGNAVLHAYPPLSPGLLFVDAGVTGRNLLLRVCDCGQGMTPRMDSPGTGIGLSLIGRLADGLEIAPNRSVGGTRVSAMFRDVGTEWPPRSRGPARRVEGAMVDEYVHQLRGACDGLPVDASALAAEARQAIDQAERLRAERAA